MFELLAMFELLELTLWIHILSGTICLLTGLAAAFAAKRKGLHTITGEIYHAAYVGVFLSSVVMAIANWSESAYLFYIAIFSYGLALIGYLARKRGWRNWMGKHIGGMLGSYIGVVTGMLVVNHGDIPLVSDLPVLLVWFLPTIVGTPLIFMMGRKYGKRSGTNSNCTQQ
ncbi:DUF2306 domain-containing protein [Brevibacillus humidisoli]|uniref:DUF2306 domain-containing protein n=1 Tax=Brevibacillus humidisoli TaxID=2895522 RepID=UPI001E5123C7|nr:DUF2306 domain-containing protein [Brevibacillus humidisoli]UFJ40411.1 DUF2306 domain-containing protein [Brevibacillus humidisoli]